MKQLLIIRGVPGAGKSSLALGLDADLVCSEDDYWTSRDGSYHFDPMTRAAAFTVMFEAAEFGIYKHARRIVIATAALSVTTPDWNALIRLARSRGYTVFCLVLQRPTSHPPSVHGLSDAEMERFRREMEHGLEVTL
jgi:hypothetical protein